MKTACYCTLKTLLPLVGLAHHTKEHLVEGLVEASEVLSDLSRHWVVTAVYLPARPRLEAGTNK